MADQGKWWKLWCSSLRDDDLENLSIHQWFGWARLGAHIKENGKDGKIRLRQPATAVVNLLRVATFDDAINMIKTFPNYIVDVTVGTSITISAKCQNWNKYQGDWSRDRVRKHRKGVTANVTPQEEKRREEKRKEEKTITTTPLPPLGGPPKIQEWFEKTWKQYPKDRRVGKKAAFRSYQRNVKVLDDALWVARALDTYLKSKTVLDGFVRNASTFFANVEDFADERRNSSSAASEMSESGGSPSLPELGIDPRTRQMVAGLGNPIPSANPKNGS